MALLDTILSIKHYPNSDKKAHLIINIEAQHNKNLDYSIIKRAEFYIGRLISPQKNVEFNKSDYDKINKVYSIWIFTSQQGFEYSSITEYKTVEYNRFGDYKEDKKDYDFFDIIMIRLGDKERPAKTEQERIQLELIKILKRVFTNKAKEPKISVRDILKNTFEINIKNNAFYKGVDDMCNLSEGIFEEGKLEGKIEGKIEGMLIADMNVDKIMQLTGESRDKILEIKDSMKKDLS